MAEGLTTLVVFSKILDSIKIDQESTVEPDKFSSNSQSTEKHLRLRRYHMADIWMPHFSWRIDVPIDIYFSTTLDGFRIFNSYMPPGATSQSGFIYSGREGEQRIYNIN